MPRLRRALPLALAALAAAAAPAAAQLPAGGFASNAELVENHATGPTSGGRLVGRHFYLTTGRELRIFDVSDPEHPEQVGSLALTSPGAGEQRAPEEDPDTNGRVLLTTNGGNLQVYDVSVPTAPKLAGELEELDQHTITCVLDCTWAYGSDGAIVDLRDPAAPKLAGDWLEQVEAGSTHDVTEVSPGMVLTATQPMLLLDARSDPLHPKVVSSTEAPGFVHQTSWPHRGTDTMMLSAGEAMGPACSENASATFATWSATGAPAEPFKLLGQFAMSPGVGADGRMPATTFCTHWFTEHPNFRGGGLIAMGWYEHGTRFLKVAPDGKVEEVGFYLPSGSRSSAAYWVTDRIVYVADYYRGLDVVRWTGDVPPAAPAPPQAGPPDSPPPGPRAVTFDDLVRLPSARRCQRPGRLAVRVRRHDADPVTALTVRIGRKTVARARGKALKRPVKVKRLPRKRFTLQVRVKTRSGKVTAGGRSYRPCGRRR